MNRLVSHACFSLLAAAPAFAQGDASSLQRLLELHAEWLGGRASLAAVRDVAAEGTLQAAGLSGTIRAELTRDGWSRTDVALGDVLQETEVVGPDVAFRTNASGQVEPIPTEDAARARLATCAAFATFLDPDSGVTVTLAAPEEKDGRTWQVVRLQLASATRDLLLDPADGSLVWTREHRNHGDAWTRHSDWREVEGVRIAFTQRSTRDDPRENAAITWREVALNPGIDRARFSKPEEASRLAEFAAGTTSTGWIPMDLHLGRYIYLRGEINGRPTDIVLDSGAGATVVDAGFAEGLGLRSAGEVVARGVGGTQNAAYLKDVEIELAGLALRGLTAVKIDMSRVGTMLGRPMPVILGKEVFHETVVDIDYPRSRIAFHAREGFAYRGDGNAAKLIAGDDGHRRVEFTVDGKATGIATVDTGSGGTIQIFKKFTEEHRLLEGRRSSESLGGGVGGRITSAIATLDSLTFAGYRLEQVPASFTTDAGSPFDAKDFDGNLGAGVFTRFRMIFDYARETLWVEPGEGWNEKPFRRDRVGLYAEMRDGALVVSFVAPGSPAAKLGVQPGAVIDALDGQRITAESWREALFQWSGAPAGAELRLTIDGEERVLTAADYY